MDFFPSLADRRPPARIKSCVSDPRCRPRWPASGLVTPAGRVVGLFRETQRPAMTPSGKVALWWSGLGFGGLSIFLFYLTVETDEKSAGENPQVSLNPDQPGEITDPGDLAMGYPQKWKGRKIVSINSEPPSGAEVTFVDEHPSGRDPATEQTEFVGYDELHYLERRERRGVDP